jgi:hypothetical protein
MDLNNVLGGTRTAEDVEKERQEMSADYVEKPGPYLVEITDAYDSDVVYDGGTRNIGLWLKVLDVRVDGRDPNNSEEERQDQIGNKSLMKIYLTKNTLETASKLLGTVAGEMTFPADFDEKAKARDENGDVILEDGNPTYNFEFVAKNAPINPDNLIGRRFVAYFEYSERNDRYEANMFNSYGVSESEQENDPADLFAGEDTRSEEYRKEREERQKQNQTESREELMDGDDGLPNSPSGGDSAPSDDVSPDDELPF